MLAMAIQVYEPSHSHHREVNWCVVRLIVLELASTSGLRVIGPEPNSGSLMRMTRKEQQRSDRNA